jgi:hypothetical protein
MPNFANWRMTEGQPEAIARVIARKSVSTGTITRGSGTVAAKTIRLETLSSQQQRQGPNGMTYTIDAFALGEYGNGLKAGDRFTVANQLFEVVMVAPGMTDNESAYLRIIG